MRKAVKNLEFGKLLCWSLLVAGMLVRSTVGEALVLHQHGRMRAHFHVIGQGDSPKGAAASPVFGHLRPGASRGVGPGTRTIAIIKTGLLFVSNGKADATEAALLNARFPVPNPLLADFDPEQIAGVDPVFSFSNSIPKSATTTLLLRNHALLI